MKLSKQMKMNSALILSMSFVANIQSEQIFLESSVGENYVIEIESNDSFGSVLDSIREYVVIAEKQDNDLGNCLKTEVGSFNMMVADNSINVKSAAKSQTIARNYYEPLTSQNKADITYIVTTLANTSLLGLGGLKSSLESAGDRVDSVHPLRFLSYIFTTEETKSAIRNLQGNSWVWKKFISGISVNLEEESKRKNMNYAQNFADTIGVDVNLFSNPLNAGKWEQFISVLIKNVPRQNTTNRYDM